MSVDVQTIVANALTINIDNFVIPALHELSDADLLKRPSGSMQPYRLVTLASAPHGRRYSLPHRRDAPGLGG